jgi:hypothetical protein
VGKISGKKRLVLCTLNLYNIAKYTEVKHLLNETSTERAIGQYFGLIQDCMIAGFNLWFKLPPEFRAIASARTRASFIHDAIKNEAKKRFANIPDIGLLEVRNLFLVKFGEEVLLRFKKCDQRFRPQNIPTRQTKLYASQGIQESLFGVPLLRN